jgi:xanthine dehydrogenase accessory factor
MAVSNIIMLRGGGDLASGVALRLHRVGLKVVITELEQPLAVRRLVSFGEAVYRGYFRVEEVAARRVEGLEVVTQTLRVGEIPVLVDPNADIRYALPPLVMVDARMTKRPPDLTIDAAPLFIGLGPGFVAGDNCHAAIETNRGHYLGRVIWEGAPQADTGLPEAVVRRQAERVLRAPAKGVINTISEIGERVKTGQILAEVNGHSVHAPFDGVLRGLLHGGLPVKRGLKIGDLDPRDDVKYCTTVSEKALAIAGGVLEAILSRNEIRKMLWN